MCQWMYYTGSACAHRPWDPHTNPTGVPIPFDERKFMQHGVWRVLFCNAYWTRADASPTGKTTPCGTLVRPDYYQMTRDMHNPGYELVEHGRAADGSPDFRCPRCRGTEPQSRSGRRTRFPRQPDWNAGA